MLKSNGKQIMKNVRTAKTSFERTKGLMFEETRKFNYALVLEMPKEARIESSIHMIFVFFPIDVLFLNKEKEVVDKATVQPFSPNYTPKKPSKYVVELPAGRAKGIRFGSKISW
ncbi:MAG: DUF192 domain-containing protein [Candidatus Diapherotrites archaeon]|nr:DUF192 domain-containing protein [Candidatus Diapherotrites archaeon]